MKIKICCISSVAEAKMALAGGADHLGLVGPMPSGPGVLDLDAIAKITSSLPEHVDTWLLTSKVDVDAILEEFTSSGASSLQLTDSLRKHVQIRLREALPQTKLIQVIHVLGEDSHSEALRAAQWADAILLDSGNPGLAVKQLGGTGRTHNWSISKRIVQDCAVPVYLAGGLRSTNVQQAIAEVQPAGLDLCSGVRTEGKLDSTLLGEFINQVHLAG